MTLYICAFIGQSIFDYQYMTSFVNFQSKIQKRSHLIENKERKLDLSLFFIFC